MNPEISFSMNLPNVEKAIQTQVYTAIDTNNAALMNEQMIYLLVMNQFKPVIGSGPTVELGSAPIAIVTNQINSWLSGISRNINVGFNYKMGTATTNQEFDVGLSTSLLDNRLLIDGTFGMYSKSGTTNTTQQSASNIVGDVNIEYVLTKNRRWRVRAFNRTNNVDALNNNAPYTQGVGLSYRREFTRLSELFTSVKKKKKKENSENGKE
jgi:hypothetical protein